MKAICPERNKCKIEPCEHREFHNPLDYNCTIFFCELVKNKKFIYCTLIDDEFCENMKEEIERILDI